MAGRVPEHETPAVASPLAEKAHTMCDYTRYRVASTLLGLICAGLGSYGAFEFAYKLERTMSYLVIAAPVGRRDGSADPAHR